MDDLAIIHRYGPRVKTSGWQARRQSYPFDNNCARVTGQAHYHSFGATNEHIIPKSTAREHQESILQRNVPPRAAKKAMNSVSHPDNNVHCKKDVERQKGPPLSTSYRDDYTLATPMIKTIDCCLTAPDPLMNKIPKSDFETLPASENKFMDDHIVKISDARKKVNFLRQIRNASNIFRN